MPTTLVNKSKSVKQKHYIFDLRNGTCTTASNPVILENKINQRIKLARYTAIE